jgi:hypothetical protein
LADVFGITLGELYYGIDRRKKPLTKQQLLERNALE